MVEAAIDARYTGGLVGPDGQFKHAHNVYLQVGAEMGLPGLVGHLALYLILLYLLARRALDRRAGYRQALALALLGSLTVFLTHGFFEVITYATRAAVVVWALFGLMVAVTTSSAGQDEMG
jgi:putative inorganic carbon (HCO3(-)) transporter